jgi:hypothetical protein
MTNESESDGSSFSVTCLLAAATFSSQFFLEIGLGIVAIELARVGLLLPVLGILIMRCYGIRLLLLELGVVACLLLLGHIHRILGPIYVYQPYRSQGPCPTNAAFTTFVQRKKHMVVDYNSNPE